MASQFENKQYDPAQFGTSQLPGGGETSTPPSPSGCNNQYYANRSDIELIFGKSNTSKWADVDNNGDLDDIDDRICWALQSAQAYLDDMLNNGPHSIPIAKLSNNKFPTQLVVECARKAGTILYDSRGVADVDADGRPQDSLRMHREQTQRFITRILAGQMQLLNVPLKTNTPGALAEVEDLPTDIYYGNGIDPF